MRVGQTMAERMTPADSQEGQNPFPAEEQTTGYDMPHTQQHTHEAIRADIIVVGADTPAPHYMACFGRYADEDAETTGKRWDGLAETMWRWGVEPMQDEPFFTVVEDGMIW